MKPILVVLSATVLLIVLPGILIYKGNFILTSKTQYFVETIAACTWGAVSFFIIQILFHLEFQQKRGKAPKELLAHIIGSQNVSNIV